MRSNLLAIAALGTLGSLGGTARGQELVINDAWPPSPEQVAANKEYIKELEPLAAKDKAKMEAAEERRARRRARNLRNL